MGTKKKGIPWGTLAAIATIIGVGYTIWQSQQKDKTERAAAATRTHHSRITLGADVTPTGATLMTSYGTWTIDPAPPPLDTQRVTVTIDGSSCAPAAMLTVSVNDAQLQLARCTFPRGSTGDLTWVDGD